MLHTFKKPSYYLLSQAMDVKRHFLITSGDAVASN